MTNSCQFLALNYIYPITVDLLVIEILFILSILISCIPLVSSYCNLWDLLLSYKQNLSYFMYEVFPYQVLALLLSHRHWYPRYLIAASHANYLKGLKDAVLSPICMSLNMFYLYLARVDLSCFVCLAKSSCCYPQICKGPSSRILSPSLLTCHASL